MRDTTSRKGAPGRLRDERGFTIVEMMVAMSILAVGLVTLAYTAGVSFEYSARARQRQDATAVGNQALEQVRALAIKNLTNGHSADDLDPATDPNIQTCGIYKCYEGERLVTTPSSELGTPLNPHISQPLVVGPTTFTRKVYLTFPTGSGPGQYRVSVVTSWQYRGRTYTKVQESTIDTTARCPAGPLHQQAGPCQNYLTGLATIAASVFTVSPAGATARPPFVGAGDFVTLQTARLESEAEVEQTGAASGEVLTQGGSFSIGTSSQKCGLVSFLSASDSDVSSFAPTAPGTDLLCALNAPASPAAGSSFITISKAAAATPSTKNSVSAAQAKSADGCSTQNDGLPCAWGTIGTGEASGKSLALMLNAKGGVTPPSTEVNLGSCPLVQVDPSPSGASTVLVNRDAATSSSDKITVTTTWRMPTITLGCIPETSTGGALGSTVPPLWETGMSAGAETRTYGGVTYGYLMRLYDVKATIVTESGLGANTAPTVSDLGGTLYYWTGTDYGDCDLTKGGRRGCAAVIPTVTQSVTVGTKNACFYLTPSTSSITQPRFLRSFVPPISASGAYSGLNVPNLAMRIEYGSSCGSTSEVLNLGVGADFGRSVAEATFTQGT